MAEQRDLLVRFSVAGVVDDLAEQAARTAFGDLAASPLVAAVRPAPAADAPPGAKSAEAVTAASLLLTVLPTAVEGVLGLIQSVFVRPGAPPVEITIEDAGGRIALRFDPRTIRGEDTVRLAADLRRQVFGVPPAGG